MISVTMHSYMMPTQHQYSGGSASLPACEKAGATSYFTVAGCPADFILTLSF